MIYKRIKPHPALHEFVKEFMFLYIRHDKDSEQLVKVLPPSPENGIEFLPLAQATFINQHTGKIFKETKTILFGQPVSQTKFIMPGEDYLVIRVIFKPGGLYRLLGGISQNELTDKIVDAEGVIANDFRIVNEQLANAATYAEMIEITEKYLFSKISRTKIDAHPVDRIGNLLLDNSIPFFLDWLASQACLSSRQLNRKFTERMGVGPKLFSRIVRFNKAFLYREMNPQADWNTIAFNFGYTDYQHLYKEFKEFAGLTPNMLMMENDYAPEKILSLDT